MENPGEAALQKHAEEEFLEAKSSVTMQESYCSLCFPSINLWHTKQEPKSLVLHHVGQRKFFHWLSGTAAAAAAANRGEIIRFERRQEGSASPQANKILDLKSLLLHK